MEENNDFLRLFDAEITGETKSEPVAAGQAISGENEEVSAPAAGETTTAQTREKAFRALMEGEYKDLFTAYFNETFNRRFREQKGMKDELDKARGAIATVAEQLGVTPDGISAAIRAETEKIASTVAEVSAEREAFESERAGFEARLRDAVLEAVARTREETERTLLENIRARGLRPVEAALASDGVGALRPDTSRLSREQRAEVARRAARGEQIKF